MKTEQIIIDNLSAFKTLQLDEKLICLKATKKALDILIKEYIEIINLKNRSNPKKVFEFKNGCTENINRDNFISNELEFFNEVFNSDIFIINGIYIREELIAFIIFNNKELEIDTVVVESKFDSLGIGKILVNDIIKNKKSVKTFVSPKNTRSLSLFTGCNFSIKDFVLKHNNYKRIELRYEL